MAQTDLSLFMKVVSYLYPVLFAIIVWADARVSDWWGAAFWTAAAIWALARVFTPIDKEPIKKYPHIELAVLTVLAVIVLFIRVVFGYSG